MYLPHETHAVAIKGSVTGDATGTVTTVRHIQRKISAIFIGCGDTNGKFSFSSAKFQR